MIKMIKPLLLACALFGMVRSHAQSPNSDIAPNGKVAQPSLNGNNDQTSSGGQDLLNVNLYTGTGNVNIPIYENTIDGLNLGVSLNYNTKGIRVDQIATSVGLGWDLNAGGSITRQVNGSEDEIVIPSMDDNFQGCLPKVSGIRGFWSVNADIANGNCASNALFAKYVNESSDGGNALNPDVFTASFAGRTVRFVIDFGPSNYKVYTYPKSEIQVKLTVTTNYNTTDIPATGYLNQPLMGLDSTNYQLGFIITDEKGNKFTFQRGEYEFKFQRSDRTASTVPYYPTTKWVLTKVQTSAGNIINYEYYNPPNYLQELVYPASQFQMVKERNAHKGEIMSNNVYVYDYGGLDIVDSTSHWRGRTTHLKSISYPNGTKVHFNMDGVDRCDLPTQSALASIVIEGKYDNVVKNSLTYKFNYAYFLSSNSTSDYEANYGSPCSGINSAYGYSADGRGTRLGLKSIDRIGTDLTTSEKYYSFIYLNSGAWRLPARLTQSQDLYGYYNATSLTNISGHVLGIPSHSGIFWASTPSAPNSPVPFPFSYGNSKSPSADYARACILSNVTNGLGGSFTIDYTAPVANVNLSAGGMYGSYRYYPDQNGYAAPANAIDVNNLIGIGQGDGLCISKVSYSDGYNNDNNTSTQYEYQDGEQFYPGGYFWQNSKMADGPSYVNYVHRDWYNNMLNPWDYPFGCNHGFKKVIVTQKNNSNQQIGKAMHEFSGIENVIQSGKKTLEVATGYHLHQAKQNILREEFLGLPLKTTQYDNNTVANITSMVENTYKSSLGSNETAWVAQPSKTEYTFTYPTNYYMQNENPFNPFEGIRHYFVRDALSQTIVSNKVMLAESKTTTYSGGHSMTTGLKYTYDSESDAPFFFDNLKKVEWTDSKGDTYEKRYAYNYNDYGVNPLAPQKLKTSSLFKSFAPNSFFMVGKEDGPFVNNDLPIVPKQASTNLGNPVVSIKKYEYDSKYNVKQTQVDSFICNSFIWDHRLNKKVAEVSNAKFNDIAYSSFEGPFLAKNTTDENKGNVDFEPSSVIVGSSSDKPMTGRYYYLLKPNSSTNYDIVSKNLTSGQKFLITFWAKQSGFNVSLGSQNLTSQFESVVGVHGWTLYSLVFIGDGNKITISSPSTQIKMDEVRIHPAKALMNTTTYEPLLGINSTCDARNSISYYEYDVQGNLSVARDMYGNILSQGVTVNQGGNN